MENQFFYSPKENHLAIVYSDRNGHARFQGFIAETESVWLGPKVLTQRYVLKEHYLGPRTAHIFLSNVLSADRVHLELELKVFYKVDPRNAAPENLIQVVNMPEAGFESIVRTNTEEKVRNDVFIRFTEDELFDPRGRKRLRTELSCRIAERVSGFGIIINPQFGVAVMNMQPNEIYQRAMQEESAARSQGNAVVKRVTPSLQKMDVERALEVFFTHLASTVTKTDSVPNYIQMVQSGDQAPVQDQDMDPLIGNLPEGPPPPSTPPQKPKREYKYPIAAD